MEAVPFWGGFPFFYTLRNSPFYKIFTMRDIYQYWFMLEKPLDINGDGTYDVYFAKDTSTVPEEYKGLAKDYDETPYQMIPVEGGYIMNYDHTSRIWNDNMYLYPVPKQCFVLNPNLDQNPGW